MIAAPSHVVSYVLEARLSFAVPVSSDHTHCQIRRFWSHRLDDVARCVSCVEYGLPPAIEIKVAVCVSAVPV